MFRTKTLVIGLILFEKNFVLKLYKTKFLSCNLKGCAVLRRIPSVVDVKAKIKPITYVFVRKKFRFKTLQIKVFIVQSDRLSCITSNTISGWRSSKNQTDNSYFFWKQFRFKTLQSKVFILQSKRLCCITSNTFSGWR